MTSSKIKDDVERWLIHESHSFESVKNHENNFQILVKHAGPYGIPVEIFEPKSQPGVIVIGAKVIMKNNQIARYLGFNDEEKAKFEKKTVFVVLDDKENINQQSVFDAIDRVSEMHEKTARFLMKTF